MWFPQFFVQPCHKFLFQYTLPYKNGGRVIIIQLHAHPIIIIQLPASTPIIIIQLRAFTPIYAIQQPPSSTSLQYNSPHDWITLRKYVRFPRGWPKFSPSAWGSGEDDGWFLPTFFPPFFQCLNIIRSSWKLIPVLYGDPILDIEILALICV